MGGPRGFWLIRPAYAAWRCSSFVMKSESESQFLNAFVAPHTLQRPAEYGPLASSMTQWWECAAAGAAGFVSNSVAFIRFLSRAEYQAPRGDGGMVGTARRRATGRVGEQHFPTGGGGR